MEKKPQGIRIISKITIFYGICVKGYFVLITSVVFIWYKYGLMTGMLDERNAQIDSIILTILNSNFILTIVEHALLITFYVCLGIGILRLKKWSLYLMLIVAIHQLFFTIKRVITLVKDGQMFPHSIILYSLIILYFLLSAYYLTRPKVKEQFK